MPATSRSGERLSRRSGSGRAGSPSKSRITQPRSVSIVWPRCRSPWVRITRPPVAGRRERLEPLAHVLAAAGDLGRRPLVGQLEEDALDLLVDVGHEQRHRLGARLVGREGRVLGLRAQRGVQLAGDAAEQPQPLEQRVGRRCAMPSSTRSQPSRAPARYSCRTPSVASMRRPWTSYQPASGAMCSKPRAERKRSSSSSGFTPGSTRRKAFRISASPKTTDELDCSTPTGRTSTLPAAPCGADGAQRKRTAPSSTGTSSPWRIRCSSSRPWAGSARRVVDRPAARLGDHALRPALGGGPQADRQLVGLVRPLAEAGLDDREHQHRRRRRAARRPRRSRSGRPRATWSRTSAAPRPSRASASSSRNERSPAAMAAATSVILAALHELEPVEAARREREQVPPLADPREARAPEDLDRDSGPPTWRGRARRPAPSARSCARTA